MLQHVEHMNRHKLTNSFKIKSIQMWNSSLQVY